MKKAMLYEGLDNKKVHCFLCNQHCRIPDSKFGFCGVRQNRDGVLYTHAYGEVISARLLSRRSREISCSEFALILFIIGRIAF